MIVDSRLSRVIASLLTIVLLLATVTFTAGWYQPSPVTATGEKTSNFLPSDTTAYFSFNLQPGYTQSTQLTYFLSFFKEAILARIHDVNSMAADFINDWNWADKVGPELALATYNVSGNPGIVFFVQVPSGRTSEDIQDLVIFAMETVLGGAPSESHPGGGITQIDRTVGGAAKTEYYTNATVSGSGDRYVLGTIGNLNLSDFQTLNASVTAGAWATISLSSNADFIDVQTNLPLARMGIGFMNGSDLQNDAIGLSGAVAPYLTALEGLIPGFSMITGSLSILSSPSFDLIEPYIPSYAGMSISGTSSVLQADFYGPSTSFPITPGISNLLSTAGLVTENAQLYYTDVNLNAWWQTLRPKFEANSSELHALADALSDAGLDGYVGFDISLLADLALDPALDANVFNWSTGEFAAARLPYLGGTGYLLVLNVSDYAQAVAKIGNLSTALGNIGISGVHWQFMAGNTSLIVGWPAGIIADMLSNPRLSSNANYSAMRASYLLSPVRGMFYFDAPLPLIDVGAAYYINSFHGRLVFRVPSPAAAGPGGGGGGGGRATHAANWEICVLGQCDSGEVNSLGTALDTFWVTSPDGEVIVRIAKHTKLKDADGKRLGGIMIDLADSIPDPPPGYKVLAAYDFTPDGATFDPGIRVTMKFNPDEVSAGQTVVAAYYDEAAGEWQFIEGTIIADGQAVFNIEHFTLSGIMTTAAPAPTPAPTVTPTPAPSGGLGVGAWAGIGIAIWIILVITFWLAKGKISGRRRTD
jgi:hypothetical protein